MEMKTCRYAAICAIFVWLLLLSVPVFAVSANAGEDTSAAAGFRDVPTGHWARDRIEQAVEKGYVSGFPDGTFHPEERVSRAQFIRMLADALKLPHVERGEPWFRPYAAALIDVGMHRETDFNGGYDEWLTRLEMTLLIDRAIGLDTGDFTDKDYVVAAAENGLIHGKGNGELDIYGYTTRAEAVVVIARVLEKARGRGIPVSEAAVEAARSL